MKASDLTLAIKNAQEILQKIKKKYPHIYVDLVLADRYGQASIGSSLEYLLEEMDHFFIETNSLYEAWDLMDEIYDLNEELRKSKKNENINLYHQPKIKALKDRFHALIPLIEINREIEICLRWDEINFDVNKKLGLDDSLIDTERSNTHIGGIKISLGTIGALAQLKAK